jgi:hypothetical protein
MNANEPYALRITYYADAFMFKRFLLITVVCLFSYSCKEELPSSILVLKGARDQKNFYTGGINRVFYRVDQKFPADDAIKQISSKLETTGWTPLNEDYLHPGISNSLASGWAIYEDPPKRPEMMIYEWSANWKDKQENIISYTLQYKDPIDKFRHGTVILKPANSLLNVNVVYMPQEVAKSMRESINKKKPNR